MTASNVNSWTHLVDEDPAHALPASLRRLDASGGRDCGWVAQMTPFVREHARGLAERGEWIVDPFCGFGTTLVAASLEGVPAVGIELDAARADLARSRLAMHASPSRTPVITGNLADAAVRARAAAGRRFGLCLTNVPYFGGLAQARDATATATDGQLYAERHYAHYLQGLRAVFGAVHALLEPGGWCVAMAQNLRCGDRFVPLAWDVARLLGERFELHDERVFVYDRPSTATDRPAAATNRAHEFAIVCRKTPGRADRDRAEALLATLARDGFEFVVFGSVARLLAGDGDTTPNDVDILCAPDDAEVSRLLRRLDALGFALESWNARATPPVATAALAYRHYFRARRTSADGQADQVDVTLAADRAAFDEAVARARRVVVRDVTVRVRVD